MIVEVHLSEHCNLKCANCAHFSQIAEKEYLNTKIFEDNFRKIDTDVLNGFEELHLLGGEPLLNDKICDILNIARKCFKKRIILITNGVRLPFMKDAFFKKCIDNNIELTYSKYPIRLQYDSIVNKLKEKYSKLSVCCYNDRGTYIVHKFDLGGNQDIVDNFQKCWIPKYSHCTQLVGTSLYTCAYGAYIRHFNKRFGYNLEDKECLDLSKVKSFKEVEDWYKKPKEFCKYCILDNNENVVPWKPYKQGHNDYLDE